MYYQGLNFYFIIYYHYLQYNISVLQIAGQDNEMDTYDDDATIDLFKMNFTHEEYYLHDGKSGFKIGMKLEAVDPLNLSSICVATIMDVLKYGYIMIRIDSYDPDETGADW